MNFVGRNFCTGLAGYMRLAEALNLPVRSVHILDFKRDARYGRDVLFNTAEYYFEHAFTFHGLSFYKVLIAWIFSERT